MELQTQQIGKKKFNLSHWAIKHPELTSYLLIVFMLLGFAAYFQLGQDEDPPFVFRNMVVRAFWPGASSQQVAEQLADKLEKTLQEVPNIDWVRSYSKPGETLIILQVKGSTKAPDVSTAWYNARKKVGDMRNTLPTGVQGPFFNDEFGDVYGIIYALHSDGFSYAELKTFADGVRDELLHVPDVAKVELFGVQDEKIYVEISQKRAAQLGLDMNSVIAQLTSQNAVESAGVLQTTTDALQVRVKGQFEAVQDLMTMPIKGASTAQLRLGDIATVKRAYADPASIKVHHQGQEVIALGVSMAKGGDIIALGKAVKEKTRQIEKKLPAGIQLAQIQDQPTAVSNSINEFIGVLIEAVIIVLGVSFLSLGLHKGGRLGWYVDVRPGIVVGITIPLVLAMTFLVMWYFNIGLHKISLGSLIIALGLLVDDAIIAVEMMIHKMEVGFDKVRAATFAYEITAMPMLTGTLITAAGFLPIGIAKSAVGEYTFAIFAVTVIALILSWIVSVYFVPYLGTKILKIKPKYTKNLNGDIEVEKFNTPFYNRFRNTVRWCVTHHWITLGITGVMLLMGLLGMGKVQQQFFPDSSRSEIMVTLWFGEGSSFEGNEAVTQRVQAALMKQEGVVDVATWIGSGVPRFFLPLDQIFPQSNVSQIIVQPKDFKTREYLRKELPKYLMQQFPEARIRVTLLPNGPPVPYPVQFRVEGSDPAIVRQLANDVRGIMQQSAATRDINDNWNEYIKVLHLDVDQDKARALGVSSQSIAQGIRTTLSGMQIGQYREQDKSIDIVLRQPKEERDALSDLNNAYVQSASGRAIPLIQIAKPSLAWEPGVMWRQNRKFAITVNADVIEGIQGATVTQELLPKLREIEKTWPIGYTFQVAGAAEESSKGNASIVAGVPVMLFIVFTLLMLQLHSFARATIVFLTGPMGIVGVAGALLIFNRPFGFVALLGVIALMGMIQRNSVILIDQIEQNRKAGLAVADAIVESTLHRLRPILLTAAAAVLAMIPLSRSVFWGPMAIAIMGGLIVATLLTLLALPAMYAAAVAVKRWLQKLRVRTKPMGSLY